MHPASDFHHILLLLVLSSQIAAPQVDQGSGEQSLNAITNEENGNASDSAGLSPDISEMSAGAASTREHSFIEDTTGVYSTLETDTVKVTTESADGKLVDARVSDKSSSSLYQHSETTAALSTTAATAENDGVAENSVIPHFSTAMPGNTDMPNNGLTTETDQETSTVTSVSLPSQMTTPSAYGYFNFSTEDYVQCFRSPLSGYFSNGLYANVTAFNGIFEFTAKQAERQKERMCIVGITVPSDMIIAFQLVNINLKCGWASMRVFQFASPRTRKLQYNYCGSASERLPEKLYILSSEASVILNIWLFSWEYTVQVNFTAMPFSSRPSLVLTRISDNLGKRFLFRMPKSVPYSILSVHIRLYHNLHSIKVSKTLKRSIFRLPTRLL